MAEFAHNQRRPSGGRSPFKERKDREFEEKVLELARVARVGGTIPFEVKVKYSSAIVYLKPAPQGRGVNAGGAVRVVASLAGIKDIIGKVLSRSGNKINNASATIEAFKILAAKNHK